jgi:hypothetical protein
VARHTGGWVKLHRKILQSWIGQDGVAMSTLMTLVMWANRLDGKSGLRGQLVTLRRGQLVTSSRELKRQLGFAKTTIERRLALMEKDGIIGTQVGHSGTIITIVNYEKYQLENEDGGTQVGRRRDADGTQTGRRRDDSGEEREEREEVETPTACAPARVDPWRTPEGAQVEARRILAKALGARGRVGSEADMWRYIGPLGVGVIKTRYHDFLAFWEAYWTARQKASQTIVDGQFREEFAAILTDPAFGPLPETAQGETIEDDARAH